MEVERRQPLEVFYSYAHEDEPLRKELEKHLHILELQGLIKGWHDRNINAGIEWASEINIHLNSAHIILLLVSPDFLSSRYCYSIEMKHAMERHYAKEAYVIPIILRPIYWQGAPFDKLQVLPVDGKPITSWPSLDDALLNVTIGIRQIIERFPLLSSNVSEVVQNKTIFHHTESIWHQNIPSCPYRSLYAFREQDAPFFFGRDIFTEQLIEKVRQRPFIAVVGPSGSGKSSLVLAGLLPRLHYEGRWQIATFRPSERPFHALASVLIPLLEPDLDEIDRLSRINKLAEPLQRGDISLYDVIERIIDKQENKLLLFADQFEELYTRCQNKEDRERFLDSIINSIRFASQSQSSRFTFIITLRADFLGHALQYRPFADELQFTDVKISSMNRRELHDAIVRPAELLGIRFESHLSERIINDIYLRPGALPLLEFTLASLWTKQRKGTLTHTAYQEIGGVENALADYAEGIFVKLSEHEQRQARQVFIQLVHPGQGTEDTRRVASRSQLKEEYWKLVIRLSDARLVICGRDEATGEEVVEVVHEALINRWSRLREWMAEDREFRIWQERFRVRMRDDDFLRGFALTEAEVWNGKHIEQISPEEQAFIQASYEQRDQEEHNKIALLSIQAEAHAKELTLHEIGRLLGEFVSFANHELKTPLTSIKGYTQISIKILMRIQQSNLLPQELNSLIKLIDLGTRVEAQILKLIQVIEDLVVKTGGRLGKTLAPLHLTTVDLASIVLQIVQKQQRSHPERIITLETPYNAEIVSVIADAVNIGHVLEEYIDNAFNYSSSDKPIKVLLEIEDYSVRVSVHDEGEGISLEEQELIWEPFSYQKDVQIVNETKLLFGRGLYISRSIIEMHQGKVGVRSSKGEGSTFWFILPLSQHVFERKSEK